MLRTEGVAASLSSLELSSMDTVEYSDIYSVTKGILDLGKLRLRPTDIFFVSGRTGTLDNISTKDLQKTEWMKVAKGYELKLILNSGLVYKFDGFKESEYINLSEYIKHNYDLELTEVELSVRGWNWGKVEFAGSLLKFLVEDKTAFEIPLGQVSQSTKGKNEVILEFHQSDEAPITLAEMRFHIPTTQEKGDDVIKNFHNQVLAKADVLQATVDAYAIFDDVPCLTPRGHYTVKAYPTFFQLHGKTFNYNIPYNTIVRLFLLPHPDNIHTFIVKCLDSPIRHGQTRHTFVIQNYTKDDMCEITLTMSDEELATKFKGKLTRTMSGPTYEVYARILTELVGRKITVPRHFKSRNGSHAISCALRANPGLLYPLEKAFLFIHKPSVLIRFDEVSSVNFARVSGAGTIRSFDFEIEAKSGVSYTFSNIAREDYSPLYDFADKKRLAIKNKGQKNIDAGIINGVEDSDNEETDHYLQKIKDEAGLKDTEDEDSDYAAESEKDDDLEYDSAAAISSESEPDAETGEKKETKVPKKKEKDKNRKSKEKSHIKEHIDEESKTKIQEDIKLQTENEGASIVTTSSKQASKPKSGKNNKRPSPQKSSKEYKSIEYINTDDDESIHSEPEKVPPPKKKKHSHHKSDDNSMELEEPKSKQKQTNTNNKRSTRSKNTADEELVSLPSLGSDNEESAKSEDITDGGKSSSEEGSQSD